MLSWTLGTMEHVLHVANGACDFLRLNVTGFTLKGLKMAKM